MWSDPLKKTYANTEFLSPLTSEPGLSITAQPEQHKEQLHKILYIGERVCPIPPPLHPDNMRPALMKPTENSSYALLSQALTPKANSSSPSLLER